MTLREFNPAIGEIVRFYGKNGAGEEVVHDIPWEVVSIEENGCVLQIFAGYLHLSPHRHFLDWGSRVAPRDSVVTHVKSDHQRMCRHCGRKWNVPDGELFDEKHRYCCGDYPLRWLGGRWQ